MCGCAHVIATYSNPATGGGLSSETLEKNTSTFTYEVPADTLITVITVSVDNPVIDFKIGTTPGGDELGSLPQIDPGTWESFVVNYRAAAMNRTLYFSGTLGGVTALLFTFYKI